MEYKDPDWVATKLGLDKNTVYKFLHDGTLPAVQLGRKWLISEARLAAWLEQQTDVQTRARRSVARLTERIVRRMETYSDAARDAVGRAITEARRLGHGYLGPEHLLLGVLADPGIAKSIDAGAVRRELEKRLKSGDESRVAPPRRLRRTEALKRAMRLTARSADGRVEPQHLLAALLSTDGIAKESLAATGTTLSKLKHKLSKEKP